LKEEWSSLVVEKISQGKEEESQREKSVGFYRNPRCKGGETEMRDTRCEMRDPNDFSEDFEGGRGYDRRGEGYDGVDDDLKGNKRGNDAGVGKDRSVKAGDGLCQRTRKKGTKGHKNRGMMF